MAAHRLREPRLPVSLVARIKSGPGWRDTVIRNVSSRGVMGECGAPPSRGDYVEVRCGDYVIVARVAWVSGDRFGARTQDVIELSHLVASSQGRHRPATDRRRHPRPVHGPDPVRSLVERRIASARLARVCEFAGLVAAGAALAVMLGGAAHDAMARPAQKVAHALSGSSRP